MDFRIQIASTVVGILIWGLVAIALKRGHLYPSYAALWIGIGSLLLLLPTYAVALGWVAANVFGIVGTNHLIYLLLFGFLLLYGFYVTQKLCQLTNRMERVIVALAILEAKVRETGKVAAPANSGPMKRSTPARSSVNSSPQPGFTSPN